MLETQTILKLLSLCDDCYDHAAIVAGPDGRDGASLSTLDDGTTVLCFRGTVVGEGLRSAIDWINDAHADLVYAEGFPGKVHAGFLDSLNALWPAVFDTLEGVDESQKPAPLPPHSANPLPWWKKIFGAKDEGNIFLPMPELQPLPWEKSLVICGHSKGGALAVLAGVRLAALKPQVITFAAPMVGNLEFAGHFPTEVKVTRFEGSGDIVPFLPPIGYRPVGELIAEDPMPAYLRRLKADQLVAEWQWEKIRAAHGTDAYRKWLASEQPPPAAAERIAA